MVSPQHHHDPSISSGILFNRIMMGMLETKEYLLLSTQKYLPAQTKTLFPLGNVESGVSRSPTEFLCLLSVHINVQCSLNLIANSGVIFKL